LNWCQNGTLPRGKDEKAIKNFYFILILIGIFAALRFYSI